MRVSVAPVHVGNKGAPKKVVSDLKTRLTICLSHTGAVYTSHSNAKFLLPKNRLSRGIADIILTNKGALAVKEDGSSDFIKGTFSITPRLSAAIQRVISFGYDTSDIRGVVLFRTNFIIALNDNSVLATKDTLPKSDFVTYIKEIGLPVGLENVEHLQVEVDKESSIQAVARIGQSRNVSFTFNDSDKVLLLDTENKETQVLHASSKIVHTSTADEFVILTHNGDIQLLPNNTSVDKVRKGVLGLEYLTTIEDARKIVFHDNHIGLVSGEGNLKLCKLSANTRRVIFRETVELDSKVEDVAIMESAYPRSKDVFIVTLADGSFKVVRRN